MPILGQVPAERLRLIEGVVAAARRIRRQRPGRLEPDFLRAYYRGVSEDDLAARSPEYLAAVALDHLEAGARRRSGQALVRVFNPGLQADGFESRHTLVTVVTDDMPFLVDSLGIVLAEAGVAVHLIVHPVLGVSRDARGRLREPGPGGSGQPRAESWQLYEIDRQLDPEKLDALGRRLGTTLADVRAAVEDWLPMRRRMRSLIAALESGPPPLPAAELREACALLGWMEDQHFVFLGYRHYRLQRGRTSDRLVPERRSGLGVLRAARAARSAGTLLRGESRDRARERTLLVLTKANSVATVHRGVYLDHVGIKSFDARGEVSGEHRFIGLWTSTAYQRSPREIPLLRRKVEQVMEHFGLAPQSHDAKAVLNVLKSYPRDELFQARVAELVAIVRSVVNLYERRTVRLLVRRDPYGRFWSCMVYVPRDRYSTDVRRRIESILLARLGGRNLETTVLISESRHARLHVVVRTDPQRRPRRVDLAGIESAIAAATTTWVDRLREALAAAGRDEAAAMALLERYGAAFPAAYQEEVAPAAAVEDLADLEALRTEPGALRLNLHRPPRQSARRVHLKIAKLGAPIPISDVLPMLENFGLRVISERPYSIPWPEGGEAHIQDFELEHRDGLRIDVARVEPMFNEAFAATWRGEVENDGFNRLLLAAGLPAREIVVLRACCRYLLQTGLPFSQAYMERVLAKHASFARQLLRLFHRLFDPDAKNAGRSREAERLGAALRASLEKITSLDEDRILRGWLGVVNATLRTNFFRRDEAGRARPWLSFKLDPAKIPELPQPRPMFEIFVYSPAVEGVHLRKGYVARGGIRWSDRREDFRTEILGLMKAQHVKNTVIVPVGAKGGFVPKRLPAGGSREDVQREGIECYRSFIRGLLDVTDNIVAGRIVPPPRVVRRDGDDAYLVVAADKGTASFSDIANAISAEYGFWLGDAFASGGSAGYDHKKMGITARGAWKCVERHFRELGVDVQSQDFTVAGIGDMSGDVFGNGMLLSKHIRLVAAFDHRHVFLDPEPDAAASFAERQRLFELPRSSWGDYDRRLVSRGGGVFERSAKSIALSPEAQKRLGVSAGALTPTEVIRAILRMPVDLLWNGGIGTYVKASGESHAEVRDRTNDALRVDGRELRAKVVGEGGNLGMTQRGRIEYALAGGRLNTDFIDNSAGVNTSDVEVNEKILLNGLERAGRLTRAARNRLLRGMTRDVAAQVLRNNYLQSQALSVLELTSAARLAEYQHLIRSLKRAGELDRALEFLPGDEELAERGKSGRGLTRPELAVVLSYSKIWLSHHLIGSDLPEDPYFAEELERYFPEPVRRRFGRALRRHRLRREIVATATTNSLVNRMGPGFVLRGEEDTGADPARIARAWTIARESFEARALWSQIEALDNRVPARAQYEMMHASTRLLRHTSYWLLGARHGALAVDATVRELRPGVRELSSQVAALVAGADRERLETVRGHYLEAGVPAALAGRIASLEALEAAFDVVELAAAAGVSIVEAARVYFDLAVRVGFDWLRGEIERLAVEGSWQAVARSGLRNDAGRLHRRLVERVLGLPGRDHRARVAAWLGSRGAELAHWQRTLADLRATPAVDFAALAVGLDGLRRLAD